jgi:hypothetical protein
MKTFSEKCNQGLKSLIAEIPEVFMAFAQTKKIEIGSLDLIPNIQILKREQLRLLTFFLNLKIKF